MTAATYDVLGRQTESYEGQFANPDATYTQTSDTWTFTADNGGSYEICINSSTVPSESDYLDYTVTSGGNTLTPTAPSNPSVTPLGTGWYDLGSVSGVSGSSLTVTYNGSDATTEICFLEQTSRTAYDADSNVLSSTDALGNATTYTYDAQGRCIQVAQPATSQHGQSVTTNVYNAAGELVQTDAPGPSSTGDPTGERVTGYVYDMLGRQIETIAPNPTTGEADGTITTRTTYDANGNVLSSTDALGNTTNYVYDNLGRQVSVQDPDGYTTQYTYDTAGRVASTTDPDGDVTAYGYNDLGQQTQTSQGQIESSPGPAWTFSNLAPNSLGAYDIYVYFSATPSNNSWQGDFTVTDANGNSVGIAPPAPGTDPAVTPLGAGWYLLGSVIATGAADTSLTVTDSNQSGAGFAAKAGLLEQTSSTTYDADGNVLTQTDALGNTTTYTYDTLGRQTTVTGQNPTSQSAQSGGPVTTYQYDLSGAVASATDSLGRVTAYQYNQLGQQTGTYQGQIANPDAGTSSNWTFAANSGGLYEIYVNSSTAPSESDYLDYSVTSGGNTLRLNTSSTPPITPLGGGWYDLGSVSDVSGPSLVITYSNGSNAPTQVCLLEKMSATSYDADGNVLSRSDALGNTTTYAYDAQGQCIQVAQPATSQHGQSVTTNVYDVADELVQTEVWGPSGTDNPTGEQVTEYVYDSLGRQIETIEPNPDTGQAYPAITTSTTYNADGNVLSTTDELGNTTNYVYDHLGRQASVEDPDGNTTHYTYDPDGNELTETDPDLNVTAYTYDAFGRETSVTNASGTTSYAYDADGNLVQKTDADNNVTTYAYDYLNRETAEIWSGGDNRTISYTYDLAGEMLTVSDSANGTSPEYAYQYNSLGQVTQTTIDMAGTPIVVLTDQYDADGNSTQLAASIGGTLQSDGTVTGGTPDFVNNYTYDSQGDMTQVTQTGVTGGDAVAPKQVDFSYDVAGETTGVQRYAAVGTTVADLVAAGVYGYDSAGRLTDLAYTDGAENALAGYHWTYDNAGRITEQYSLADTSSSSDPSPSDYTTWASAQYNYDADGQLVNNTSTSTPAVTYANWQNAPGGGSESYAVDANGNSRTGGTVANNQVQSDGTYIYTYDANGNLVEQIQYVGNSGGSGQPYEIQYQYDNRNRLTSVTDKDSTGNTTQVMSYTYDAFNNLVGRTVTLYNGGQPDTTSSVERYVFDGTNMVLQFDGTSATGSPAALTASDLSHRYLWGPAVDQILADEQVPGATAGTTVWTLTDNQNTVRDLAVYTPGSPGTTAIVNHQVFSAYGQFVSQTIPGTSPLAAATADCLFAYTGSYYDSATGLQWNQNRWYNPATQRRLTPDPLGLRPDANPYRYCGNGPTNGTDPSGEFDLSTIGNAISNFVTTVVNGVANAVGAALPGLGCGWNWGFAWNPGWGGGGGGGGVLPYVVGWGNLSKEVIEARTQIIQQEAAAAAGDTASYWNRRDSRQRRQPGRGPSWPRCGRRRRTRTRRGWSDRRAGQGSLGA